MRGALAAAALPGLLVPNDTVSVFACFAVLAAIGYWLVKRRALKPLARQAVASAAGRP